jgi:predicted amidophosphoribosyltransferase
MDVFDNTILCRNCGKKMKPAVFEKEGFRMRALKCPSCSNIIVHPIDLEEFNKFKQLRGRQFQVKLRFVGNSYTVSIPREIVNFMKEEEEEKKVENIHQKMQEHMNKQIEEMQKFVTLALKDSNMISMMFNQNQQPSQHNEREEKDTGQNKKLKTPKFSKVGGIKIKSE